MNIKKVNRFSFALARFLAGDDKPSVASTTALAHWTATPNTAAPMLVMRVDAACADKGKLAAAAGPARLQLFLPFAFNALRADSRCGHPSFSSLN